MTKYLSLIIVTLVAIVSYLFLSKAINHPKIYQDVTVRAQNYIQDQQKKNNPEWNNVKVVPTEAVVVAEPSQEITNDCFSFRVPFPILKSRSQGRCNNYITTSDPRGEITIYQQSVETRLDQNPGIAMRRADKTMYNESSVVIGGREYLIFTENSDSYMATAFSQTNYILDVVNMKVYVHEDLFQKFSDLIESISYK